MNGVYPSDQCNRIQAYRVACCESLAEMTSLTDFFQPANDVVERFEELGEIDHRFILLRSPRMEQFARPLFVADQICRRTKRFGLFPQKSVYLGNDKTGSMIPRRAFDQPIFIYHYGKSLINNVHQSKHEYTLKLENAMQNHYAVINNSYACVKTKSGEEVLRIQNPMNDQKRIEEEQNPCETEDENGEDPVDLSKIQLKNGEFFYRTPSSKYKVQVVLNTAFTTMTVEKAEMYKNKGTIEVIVLFDGHFMATGRFTFNTNANKVVCELAELPGTYGTSDFDVSPDHKSMIRTCNVQTRVTTPETSIKDKVEEEQEKLQMLHGSLTSKLETCLNLTIHEHGQLIETLCPNLDVLNRLCESFQDSSFRPDALPSTWSSRERIVYSAYALTPQEACDTPDKRCTMACEIHCRETLGCKKIRKFLMNVEKYSKETVPGMSERDFVELCIQLRLASEALSHVLNAENKEGFEDWGIQFLIQLFSNFRQLYQHPLGTLAVFCQMLPEQSQMIECLVEVIASRATPANCGLILDVYRKAPKTVLRVMKEYAWLMLFGVGTLTPSMHFLHRFLIFLDNTLLKQYQLRDENVRIGIHTSLFKSPQLPPNRNKRGLERREIAQDSDRSGHQGPPKRQQWYRDIMSVSRESSVAHSVHPFLSGETRRIEEPTDCMEAPQMRRTINHQNIEIEKLMDLILPEDRDADPVLNPHLANKQ